MLEFPENLPALVDEGSLVIDLEVDTREEGKGWFDAVLFTENGRLDLPESGRMGMSLWEKAEEYSCPNLVCDTRRSHFLGRLWVKINFD